MLVKTPIDVPKPNENEEVHHVLPGYDEEMFKLFWDEANNDTNIWLWQDEKRLKVNVKIKDEKVTVHLSGEINIDSVKNWMKEHMEAYPETAAGFYARFIDHTEEDTWYIVLPCDKNKSNSIDINWLYYKIYPFWDHSNKFVNTLGKELSNALTWNMSEDEVRKTIKKEIIDVIKLSPLDAKWIIKLKNELIDFLLHDTKLLTTFWDKKNQVYHYINNAFVDIEDNNKN